MSPYLTPRLAPLAAVLAAAAVLVSGCGAGSRGSFDPPATLPYANSQLSFDHPATWKAYPFRWKGGLHFQPMLYLSTQPVHDPCSTQGDATTCSWPVRRLQPGGVLVVWENRGFPGWTLNDAPGTSLQVGGRSAKRTAGSTECRSIGGDVTIDVAIASPLQFNWTQVTACLRGPNVAANERAVAAMLASTRFLPA